MPSTLNPQYSALITQYCSMVGATGFEPATPCAQGRCATRLRYAPSNDRSHSTRGAYEIKVLRANQPETAMLRPSFFIALPR